MATARIGGGRVEACLVRLAGAYGLLHGVVDLEDNTLGAVVEVVLLLVPPADDGEGAHDVGHGVARGREAGIESRHVFRRLALRWKPFATIISRQIEMEKGGVQLTTEEEAALLIPAERRAGPSAVLGEQF